MFKNSLHNTPKHFVVAPVDKATGNIALVCKTFYGSVISRKLRLNNNSSTDIYRNAGVFSRNHTLTKI